MKGRDNVDSSIKRVSLKSEDEITGFYRELRRDICSTTIVLELIDGKKIEISFPTESMEAEIIRKALCRVKRGIRISILRLADPKTPIRVLKIPNLRSKKGTRYIRVRNMGRLEPFREPGEPIETAFEKVLGIVERRETIVAVVYQNDIQCNRMKEFGKTEEIYCSMLETTASKKHCLEKCVIATQLQKLLDKTR